MNVGFKPDAVTVTGRDNRVCYSMAPTWTWKVVKGVKSNDLCMFFGPGGSQPKPVPAVQKSVPTQGEKKKATQLAVPVAHTLKFLMVHLIALLVAGLLKGQHSWQAPLLMALKKFLMVHQIALLVFHLSLQGN